MKIEIYLPSTELHIQVIQALLNAQLLDKVQLSVLPDPSQEKSSQFRGLTNSRECRIERRGDNTLLCSACGRTLPSTSQGEIDLEQVAREMAFRRW